MNERPTPEEVRGFVELCWWLAHDDAAEMEAHPPDDEEYWIGPQLEASKRAHPSNPRDRGAVLLEVVMGLLVLGLVLVPVTTLLITTMRAGNSAALMAEQAALMSSAAVVAPYATADPCGDLLGYETELAALLQPADGWTLQSDVEQCAPTLVRVTVVQPSGHARSVLTAWEPTP